MMLIASILGWPPLPPHTLTNSHHIQDDTPNGEEDAKCCPVHKVHYVTVAVQSPYNLARSSDLQISHFK